MTRTDNRCLHATIAARRIDCSQACDVQAHARVAGLVDVNLGLNTICSTRAMLALAGPSIAAASMVDFNGLDCMPISCSFLNRVTLTRYRRSPAAHPTVG
jgi:hypothetical protein